MSLHEPPWVGARHDAAESSPSADRLNDRWYRGLDTGAITSSSPRHLSRRVRCAKLRDDGLASVTAPRGMSSDSDGIIGWKKSVGFQLVVRIFGKSICSSRDFGSSECSFFFRIHICGHPLRFKNAPFWPLLSELTGRKRSSEQKGNHLAFAVSELRAAALEYSLENSRSSRGKKSLHRFFAHELIAHNYSAGEIWGKPLEKLFHLPAWKREAFLPEWRKEWPSPIQPGKAFIISSSMTWWLAFFVRRSLEELNRMELLLLLPVLLLLLLVVHLN